MTSLDRASSGTWSRRSATVSRYCCLRVAPAHRGQDPIGPGLERQVEVGAHARQVPEGVRHPGVHVLGVRRREAQAPESFDAVHAREQAGEVGVAVAVGVDRLPQEHDLGEAPRDQALDLANDVLGRAVDLGAPGPRHHAEAADVVAALHRGDVGPDRVPVGGHLVRDREGVGLAVEVDRRPGRWPRPRRAAPGRGGDCGCRRGRRRGGRARAASPPPAGPRSRRRRSAGPGAAP